MRTLLRPLCVLTFATFFSFSARSALPDSPSLEVLERGPHHKLWQRSTNETRNGVGILRTNRFMEVASGAHYFDEGQWKEAKAEISITQDGAAALTTAHKVQFKGNINSAAALTITTPDDKVLKASVRGLAYTDPGNGEVVMFATVRDSEGLLLPPDTVLYPNAFSGTKADVRAMITKARFESDVILREKLPSPANWNLNPETTLLEVWTEFEAPEPNKVPREGGSVPDTMLDWGAMRMGRGTAFSLDAPLNRRSNIPVGKTWLTVAGKTYLIESVRYAAIAKELAQLPAPQAAVVPANGQNTPTGQIAARSRVDALARLKPSPKLMNSKPIQTALNRAPLENSKGLVLDYTLSAGNRTNFTFQADTTYFVNGEANFFGETRFEGGTVVKLATTNASVIQMWDAVSFLTDTYRPAIFTSQMDRSVGEDFYASGAPTNYSHALSTGSTDIDFHHLRISYADYGLHTFSTKVRHAQFLHCGTALFTEEGTAEVNNALFYNCNTVFGGFYFNNVARHVTVDRCTTLALDNELPDYSSVALTNSLLVNVASNGNVALATNYTVATAGSIFQTAVAGAHYLADSSPYRDVGTTDLPAALAADLRKLTTYAPLFTNGFIAQDTTLNRTAPRDTDIPDLGWHAPPLDYLVHTLVITNSTLTVAQGVAIGVYSTNSGGYFATLLPGGNFVCEGRADELNHIVAWQLAQELPLTNYVSLGTLFHTPFAGSSPAPGLMRLRFTEIATPGANTVIVSGHDPITGTPPLAFVDCQFYGGSVSLQFAQPVAFTNNLFFRVYHNLIDNTEFRNNTFYGGTIQSTFSGATGGFYDNIFDSVSIDATDTPNGYNGYTITSARMSPTNIHNVLVNNMAWQVGPLGRFYLPTNSAFINAGSRNADVAGLYHYTSVTNQMKEINSVVDIGFHYVATDANGTPLDYDGDGVPDYGEDANGNGAVNSGETDWQSAADLGLKVLITRPRNNSTIP